MSRNAIADDPIIRSLMETGYPPWDDYEDDEDDWIYEEPFAVYEGE